MKDIKRFSTQQLVAELSKRFGVIKIAAGPYKDYSLKKKFSKDQAEIKSDCILVMDAFSYTPDSSSKQS